MYTDKPSTVVEEQTAGSSSVAAVTTQPEAKSQQSSSSNSNGNANSEIVNVNTSEHSPTPIQLNYAQVHNQVTWLPLGTALVPNFLTDDPSLSSTSVSTQKESYTINSDISTIYSTETSSQLSTISSPSSTTNSSSPPGSAAILCSPPPSLLAHQGGLVDMVSGQAQAGPSNQDNPEEGGGPIVCQWEGCNQVFQSLSQLVLHLDKGHTLSMSQYICYWKGCQRNFKPFDARYKLITHLRCHTGEKPFKCEVANCNRSFSRLENLKLHVRTHTGEKPYECHYEGCLKRFNNTSDRAKHMKTHVMRKPYACKYPGCEKSYTDPSSMRKHIKYSHKLKERPTSSSGSSNETSTSGVSSIAPLKVLSGSHSSAARAPSLSPSSLVFHNPNVTALSPPIHLPHASLPQESASIAHSTTVNAKRKLPDGTQLIAPGPIIGNQQPSQVPQLIPIPLVQLPSRAPYQNQLLGLMPRMPQVPKGMILLPSTSSTETSAKQQPVIQVISEPSANLVQPPVTSAIVGSSSIKTETSEEAPEPNVEAQLRMKIVRLQQELTHTQTLLAHQNAAIQQQQSKQLLWQQPMLIQQVSPRMTPQMIAHPTNRPTPITHSTSADHHPLTTGADMAIPSLTTPTTAGSPQLIPIMNSQGLQFLYTASVPHSSV